MDQKLTTDGTVIVLIDLQEGIVNVGATADAHHLRHCATALTDLAGTFGIPVLFSCVPTTGGTVAPVLAEIAERLPQLQTFPRSTVNPMDDDAFRAALHATGRRTVVLAGVATEVAVQLAALGARRADYDVTIAVDACGGIHPRSEEAAFRRMTAAGVTLSSVAVMAGELGYDFDSEPGAAAMRVLQSLVWTPHLHHQTVRDLPF